MEKDKRPYSVDEEQFNELVAPVIEASYIGKGRPLVDALEAFCGIPYILRTGVPWRDLSGEYGEWHTVYDRFWRFLESNDNVPVIPGRKNRKTAIKYDEERHKRRGLIERIFGKMRECRRLVARHEKSDADFLGFVLFAFLKILLC